MHQKVIIKVWWESGLSSAPRNHLTTSFQTFRPLNACLSLCSAVVHLSGTIVIFCLLWLSSASADRIGYITSFCSMIKLLPKLKNSSC